MPYDALTTIRSSATKALTDAVDRTFTRGLDQLWTSDSAGVYGSLEKHAKALQAFIQNHPKQNAKRFGVSQLSAQDTRAVLKIIADGRGRVSSFDLQLVRSVMAVNIAAGRSVEGHKELLKILGKRVTLKKHPGIQENAGAYRDALLAYSKAPNAKARQKGFLQARSKFIFALLCNIPIRLNSLHVAKRSWIVGNTIYLPSDATKNRKELTIELPTLVKQKLDEYLAHRTDDQDNLIAEVNGNPILKQSLYRSIIRNTNRAIGVQLNPHSFRAIVATWSAKKFGSETAADLLVITPQILRKHYYISSESSKMSNALNKINEGI